MCFAHNNLDWSSVDSFLFPSISPNHHFIFCEIMRCCCLSWELLPRRGFLCRDAQDFWCSCVRPCVRPWVRGSVCPVTLLPSNWSLKPIWWQDLEKIANFGVCRQKLKTTRLLWHACNSKWILLLFCGFIAEAIWNDEPYWFWRII